MQGRRSKITQGGKGKLLCPVALGKLQLLWQACCFENCLQVVLDRAETAILFTYPLALFLDGAVPKKDIALRQLHIPGRLQRGNQAPGDYLLPSLLAAGQQSFEEIKI